MVRSSIGRQIVKPLVFCVESVFSYIDIVQKFHLVYIHYNLLREKDSMHGRESVKFVGQLYQVATLHGVRVYLSDFIKTNHVLNHRVPSRVEHHTLRFKSLVIQVGN